MKLLVLINPSSHGGRALKKWEAFRRHLPECESVVLKNIGEATGRAAAASGFDVVAACGGDGTVNAVAEGILRNPDRSLKMGVLYAGTSPDFCRYHHIPTDPSGAAELLMSGRCKPVRLFEIRHDGKTSHFACSCNLGMGADVAELANRLRPRLGDRLGTFCALVRNLWKSKRYCYSVNGEKLNACNHLLITRMPYIAGGLKLALPEFGGDEYAVWHLQNMTFSGWPGLLTALYRGTPAGTLRIVSGTTRITSPETVKVEYDGDFHGHLPVEIRVAEHTLQLIAGG